MRRLLQRFVSDRRGNAAIEFAFIFPVIFMLHVAAVEALQAYQAQRSVAHIASAMADITAQNQTVTTSDLNDIMAASVVMIQPFPNVSVQQRVASMSANGSGTVASDWQAAQNYTSGPPLTVPNGYLLPNESVVVTDVVYDYHPTFRLFMPATIQMKARAYARPRLSSKVSKV